jgi:hypothetical protein
MKRKDFAKYGEREGIVLAVQHDGGIVWQDMTVDMCSKSGRPITNHPIVLSEKDLKRPKKREYSYTALSVSVGRVTERAIGCNIAGMDFFVPKSLCNLADSTATEEGQEGDLLVADWWYPKALKEKEDDFITNKGGGFDAPPVAVPDDGIPF